jgi:hypothetical protein
MSEAQDSIPDEPRLEPQWSFVFMLLSMDVVAAFYDLIGAGFAEPACVVDVLRRQIVRARYPHAEDPSGPRFGARDMIAAIAQRCGEHDARRLVWWTAHLFDAPRRRELYAWECVLREVRNSPAGWPALGLPAPDADAARQWFAQSLATGEYQARSSRVYAAPLSDWDLHLYAVNLFDDEDPALANGPDRYVHRAMRDYAAHRFWGHMNRAFSPDALARFRDGAERFVAARPALRFTSPLADPRGLDIGAAS